MKVSLANVRIDLMHVFKPHETKGDDGTIKSAFKARFIIEPGSPNDESVKKAILTVAEEKWGANYKPVLENIVGDKLCRRKGSTNLDKENQVRKGYDEMVFVAASSQSRPVVVDQQRRPLVEDDGKPYPGSYVNAIIDIYAQEKPIIGKGIFAGLGGVQFWADGERLGGGAPVAASEFEQFGAAPQSASEAASDFF